MRIYRKVVTDIETGERLHEDSFEYGGPLAQCYFDKSDQKSKGTQQSTSAQYGAGSSRQTSRASSQQASSSDPSALLAPAASGVLGRVGGVAEDFMSFLQGIFTGGGGVQTPIIAQALERSKGAASTAMRGTEEQLTQRGLAGTPFGEKILAGQRATSAAETGRVGTDIVTQFMSMIPGVIGQAQQTGIGGLGQARTERASGTSQSASDAISDYFNQAISQSTGKERSEASSFGSGMKCCFIFLAGAGQLSQSVRRYRDSHMNVRNRRGYYWLADCLVPLMEKSKAVKYLVNLLMVRPMTYYGDYYYKGNSTGFVCAPITQFWLTTFTLLGYRPPYRRRGTEEVV